MYAYAVHKRGHGASGLRCYVMHPGWADTDGVKTAMPNFRRRLRTVLRNAAQGADTALWLAATRPADKGAEAFWFDRAPRAAHAFPHTMRSKYKAEDLAAFLAKEAANVGSNAKVA